MQTYEVEIKALLGSSEKADEVRAKLKNVDPACKLVSKNKQLNHYFVGGALENLPEVVRPHLHEEAALRLEDIATKAQEFSVRTREKDGQILFVVKASVGADTSANGVARIEFEETVEMPLDQLDALILSAGFTYQAKWSREREEYFCRGFNVTLDKNAGYGWLAEFERVIEDASKVDDTRKEIAAFMDSIGVLELPQERLERMFSYYNAHWQDYYGSDKIFTIE